MNIWQESHYQNPFPMLTGRHYAYDGFRPNNPRLPLEVFQVRKGEKFYFRLICSSLELAMAVSIDKHPLHVVATDGSDIVTTTVDIINISPGERYDFWIDATDPDGTGLYWMRILTMELLRGNWIVSIPIAKSSQHTYNVMITSPWRQNDLAVSLTH